MAVCIVDLCAYTDKGVLKFDDGMQSQKVIQMDFFYGGTYK